MKSVEFCYWLQGMFELQKPKAFNAKQTEQIKKHLALVFKHEIDPSYPNRKELDKIHGDGDDHHAIGGEMLIRC